MKTPDEIIAAAEEVKSWIVSMENCSPSSDARFRDPLAAKKREYDDLIDQLPFNTWNANLSLRQMFDLWNALGRPGNQGPNQLNCADLIHLAIRKLERVPA